VRGVLLRFWLQQFAGTFTLALVLLGLSQYVGTSSLTRYLGVFLWSGISALVAASAGTYWS
jgi:hypothetical protein